MNYDFSSFIPSNPKEIILYALVAFLLCAVLFFNSGIKKMQSRITEYADEMHIYNGFINKSELSLEFDNYRRNHIFGAIIDD